MAVARLYFVTLTLMPPLLLLPSVMTTSLSDPDVRDHYIRVREFRCAVPRPSVVALVDLPVSGPDVSSKHFVPEMTVLHRCDAASGCCGPGLTCGPAATETVSLPFLVTYMVDIVGHPRNSSAVERVEAVNHTRCECLPWGQPPR